MPDNQRVANRFVVVWQGLSMAVYPCCWDSPQLRCGPTRPVVAAQIRAMFYIMSWLRPVTIAPVDASAGEEAKRR